MFERPQSGERALIVHVAFQRYAEEQASLAEFAELVRSTGAILLGQVTTTRNTPDPHAFIGRGKLEELATQVAADNVEVVLFNHSLSPAQERNLEKSLKCRVLDRSGVILDIFAQRARSFEGKLQVELAQLKHLSTRLIRGWTHLERQKGGIGLRGPGETQLETDRRLLGERIKHIHRRLEKVRQQRELSRRARQRAALPVVSLVGYTNAGKSTLFNQLTQANVYAADQLFATLDATLRRITLSNKIPIILADTVGFIQQLPHDLIAAFRATLEETRQASLLLHVVDASDTARLERIEQVNQVLVDIEANKIPQILVYNKVDCLAAETVRLERNAEGRIHKVWLSAQCNMGLDLLQTAIIENLNLELDQQQIQRWVRIPARAGQLRAKLFALGGVLQERYADNGDCELEIQMQSEYFQQLTRTEPDLQLLDAQNYC